MRNELFELNDKDFEEENIDKTVSKGKSLEVGYMKTSAKAKEEELALGYMNACVESKHKSKKNKQNSIDTVEKVKIEQNFTDKSKFEESYIKAWKDTQGESIQQEVIEAKVVLDNTNDTEEIPWVKATVISSHENAGEEKVVKDKALRIAQDFVRRNKIISVGDKKYLYNKVFYSPLKDRELQSMLFRDYYGEISQGNALAILNNAAKLVDVCIEKQLEEFPVNSNLIVFENCTLDIRTGRPRTHSPNDITSSALGIQYHPNRWEMPNTERFLRTIADGDEDLYELMLQVIGYILSNDIRAKAFFYLEGVGDAGKSRFCDLVASFFQVSGANKVARIALQDLDGKFSLGNLVNAKLNISEDLPDKPLTAATVSRIKMLSDSNRIEAEAKYVQAFSFRPTCKFLFASNHPLRLKEFDQAFINRVVYIPFLNAIPKAKQDRNILVKMQKELSALFNHAFEAYKRLVANAYVWAGSEKFKPRIEIVSSGVVVNKTGELREFLQSCCTFEEDYKTSVADLQEAYNMFCRQHGYSPVLGARFSRELKQVLPETVVSIKLGNSCRGYKGIKLLKNYKSNEFVTFD